MNGAASIRFTHKDRLGSTTTFTDHNGNATGYRSYDPFGKPKMGNGRTMASYFFPPRGTHNINDPENFTKRGFTGHEHLDEVELIHMNGRVYDYNLGRFMSVDPFIQGNGNSQGINPYSYVINNPLKYTDPSGYSRIERRRQEKEEEYNELMNNINSLINNINGKNKTKNGAGNSGNNLETIVDIESRQEVAQNPTNLIEQYEKYYGASYVGTDDKGLTGHFEVDNTSIAIVETKIGEFSEILYHGSLEGTGLDPFSPPNRAPDSKQKLSLLKDKLKMSINESFVTAYRLSYDVMEDRSIRSGTIGSFSIDFASGKVIERSRTIRFVNETISSRGILTYDKLITIDKKQGVLRSTISKDAKRVRHDNRLLKGKE